MKNVTYVMPTHYYRFFNAIIFQKYCLDHYEIINLYNIQYMYLLILVYIFLLEYLMKYTN